MSLGVALAHKDKGRLVVDLQPDGDLMFDAGALWIAARYRIPMLVVMYNNRAYLNDWEHQIHVAEHRGTPVERAHVGQDIVDPPPDFATIARAHGLACRRPDRAPGRRRRRACPRHRRGQVRPACARRYRGRARTLSGNAHPLPVERRARSGERWRGGRSGGGFLCRKAGDADRGDAARRALRHQRAAAGAASGGAHSGASLDRRREHAGGDRHAGRQLPRQPRAAGRNGASPICTIRCRSPRRWGGSPSMSIRPRSTGSAT